MFAVSYMCIVVAGLTLVTTASGASKVYEDDRIELTVPDGWSLQRSYQSFAGDRTGRYQIGVVLIDGRLELYVLAHYGQTSGIVGGRFSEISKFIVPWLKSSEPDACFSSFQKEASRVTNQLSRVNLFLRRTKKVASKDPACDELFTPSQTPVWAGAYFGLTGEHGQVPGFFLNLPVGITNAVPDHQMVLAEAVRTSTPSALPNQSDPGLVSFLKLADEVVKGLRFR